MEKAQYRINFYDQNKKELTISESQCIIEKLYNYFPQASCAFDLDGNNAETVVWERIYEDIAMFSKLMSDVTFMIQACICFEMPYLVFIANGNIDKYHGMIIWNKQKY